MKKNIIATILLVLILILCVGYWQYTITKPEYSFWQAKKAIDENDLILFDKYVDTGLLVENIVDQFMEIAITNAEKKSGGLEEFDSSLAKDIVVKFKPQLTSIVKQQLVSFLKTGDLEKQSKSQEALKKERKTEFSFKNIWNNSGENKSDFQGVEYVKEEGKTAYIGLKFFLEKLAEPFIVDVKMRSIDNFWQVTEIVNFSNLMKKLDKLNNGQLKALEKSIFEQIKSTLIVDKSEKYNFGDMWDEKVNFEVKLKNERSKTVNNLKTRRFYYKPSGKQVTGMPLLGDEKISLEQSDDDNLSFNVQMSINYGEELYKKEQEKYEEFIEWSYMQQIFKW
jgi:hypothetical protein